jgi:hypothetical protein
MMFSPFFTDFNAKAVEIPMILDRIWSENVFEFALSR